MVIENMTYDYLVCYGADHRHLAFEDRRGRRPQLATERNTTGASRIVFISRS